MYVFISFPGLISHLFVIHNLNNYKKYKNAQPEPEPNPELRTKLRTNRTQNPEPNQTQNQTKTKTKTRARTNELSTARTRDIIRRPEGAAESTRGCTRAISGVINSLRNPP